MQLQEGEMREELWMQEEGNELSQWVHLQRKLCQLRMALVVGVLGDCLRVSLGQLRIVFGEA